MCNECLKLVAPTIMLPGVSCMYEKPLRFPSHLQLYCSPVALHSCTFPLIPLISSYFLLTVEYPYLYEPRSAIYWVTCFQGIFVCARRRSETPLLDDRC